MSLLVGGLTVATAPQAAAVDWSRCTDGPAEAQQVYARAAQVSGVPEKVLLAVSYLESRWEDHDGRPSTSGGYGPMHLTLRAVDADQNAATKGESRSEGATRAGTLVRAADLTGLAADRLRTDPVANICGGAAVLASYQPRTAAGRPQAWSRAVALYAGAADEATALRFARQVFDVLRTGEARTTGDGDRVVLASTPGARVDVAAVQSAGLLEPGLDEVECPADLGCEAVPAPYELYGDKATAYGNYDLADRPHDLAIDTIVIHNTEGTWDRALELVQDPTYLAWHYTLRSSDGHVAQHVANRNVGWHAGNWYTNMHSIGLEHEGIAAEGATWFTESMYRSSATLVRYLAQKYDVPLDRAHVIGHDQVPGHAPARVALMHWDTGPFWDWEHYMELLGAPLAAAPGGGADAGDVVTVAPGFDTNQQTVTGCEDDGSCDPQGTNFVYLHTAPRFDAPLVKDEGLHTDGSHSTTEVWDIGARAAAGDQLVVSKRVGDWLRVWWLGRVGWIHSPLDDPAVLPAKARVVRAAGDTEVPVYGRAYPEASAYPAEIPVQSVVPLQYTIKPGQAYVLADGDVPTDYYYAKTYDDSLAGDHTVVRGDDVYYEIWFGHRMAYVRAADVRLAG